MCTSIIQTVTTKFTEGKQLSTSYTTLLNISEIQCVRKCTKERQTGGCTLAGYNKVTKSCYLSVDGLQDVLDTADKMFGVFFYKLEQTGNKRKMVIIVLVKSLLVIYNDKLCGQQKTNVLHYNICTYMVKTILGLYP